MVFLWDRAVDCKIYAGARCTCHTRSHRHLIMLCACFVLTLCLSHGEQHVMATGSRTTLSLVAQVDLQLVFRLQTSTARLQTVTGRGSLDMCRNRPRCRDVEKGIIFGWQGEYRPPALSNSQNATLPFTSAHAHFLKEWACAEAKRKVSEKILFAINIIP